MSTIQISQFPTIPQTPANADVLPIEVNGITYKVSKAVLAAAIYNSLYANNMTTTQDGLLLDARQGRELNLKIAAVTPVIYDKVITGVSVSTDGGYSAAIPYSTIGSGIVYAKMISCFLRAWSADAILVPQPYTDGLYIYSTKAFSNKNVHVRIVCLP